MKFIYPIWIPLAVCYFTSCSQLPDYKKPLLPVETRVEDLLSRMTLEEKAAQLDMVSGNDILLDTGTINEALAVRYIDSMNIGSIHDLYPQSASIANAIQKRAIENSRLGIPLLFIEEALHGYQGKGATTFPIPIGLASSWDTSLIYQIGRAIGSETRAHGVHFILGPNLDLARDIRWGRVEETYGEDVYFTSRMGVNLIKGLQGLNLTDDDAVIAEPKHFAMHGAPENGSNEGPVFVGEREARSTGLYIFEKAVKEAKAKGIMAAYHELDGIPCISNKWLLTEILREEWHFDGFVLSDLGAIKKQVTLHRTAANDSEAILNSMVAGVDMQFYDFSHDDFQRILVESVRNGSLSEAFLDRAVRGVLRNKFILGLFDNPYTDEALIKKRFHSGEHREIALRAARESVVLLKNEKNALPLKSAKKITITGSLAKATYTGGYSPTAAKAISVYDAIKQKYQGAKIDYINVEVSDRFANIQPSFLTTGSDTKDNGLKVEYFNRNDLKGVPAYSGVDANLNSFWHNLSPAPGVDPRNFSARWEGFITVPITGLYEFDFRADGYGRISLNNQIFIDNWNDEWANRGRRKTIRLNAGDKVPFCLDFSKLTDEAGIWLKWRLAETKDLGLYSLITKSVEGSDVVVVVIGEGQDEVGESRDKSDLNPNSMDMMVLQAAAKAGKPVITVLQTGRPLILTDICKYSDALLQAWYGGEFAGTAVADIIHGDYNPSGHLAISFPEKLGQLPIYYSKKPSSHRNYIGGAAKPLFPFGYGLSFTSFDLKNLSLSSDTASVNDDIMVSVDVSNTGVLDGAEVIQIYVRDKVSSVEIPDMQLKAFANVFLRAGETKKVNMLLRNEQLSLINADMKRIVEPGVFEIMSAFSSEDIRLRKDLILK